MEYRYHPIIENLKVNEDGSDIILNGEHLTIKIYQPKHTRNPTQSVHINRKKISIQKLVCEAWHGVTPNGEYAARRVDERNGNHYSNLYWGKKGMTLSSASGAKKPQRKMTLEVCADIVEESKNTSVREVLKGMNISEMTFYRFRKKYVKKD